MNLLNLPLSRSSLFLGLLALPLVACSNSQSVDHDSDEQATPSATEPSGTGGGDEPAEEPGAETDEGTGGASAAAAPLTGEAAVEALRAHVKEFNARPEHDAETVRVQHLLVSFAGTRTRATRTKAEAELLAAELWAQIQANPNVDYVELIRKNTDDSPPGIYLMTASSPTVRNVSYNRKGMVPAFGNAGWRLEVGEFGVAGFDPTASPYGWHIVKRIE